MASELVIMPLGADEPKASSNLRFCSVRWMSLRVSASPCENGVVLVFCVVIEHRANRSRVSHEGTETRSLGSDVVHVSVLTTSINFNPASLLYLTL